MSVSDNAHLHSLLVSSPATAAMNTVMRTATSSKACASAVPIFQFVKCAAPRRPQQHRWAPDVSSFRSVERHNVQRREVRVLAAAAPPPGLTCEPWTGSAEQQQVGHVACGSAHRTPESRCAVGDADLDKPSIVFQAGVGLVQCYICWHCSCKVLASTSHALAVSASYPPAQPRAADVLPCP